MIYLCVIVAVLVLDRLVKSNISTGMSPGESTSVIGDFFHITYVQNTGAAFSMLEGHMTLLIVVPAVIITIAFFFIIFRHKAYKPIFMYALSLMIGGGLGNLLDRAAYGYVIDMFDFGSFPVFNVADIAVCAGCGLLVVYMIVYESKNPKQKGR